VALPIDAQDGDKEPCPNPECTEKVRFYRRTPIPITGAEWVPDGGTELEPAWTCGACGYYEAVSQPFNG